MKKIRQLSQNGPFAIFLSLALLFVTSCSKNTENARTNPVISTISGEQLFREIFLFQGQHIEEKIPAYAEVVSVLNNESDVDKAAMLKFNDKIVTSIKATNPEFFDELRAAVSSKGLYQIKQEIVKGGSLIIASIQSNQAMGPLVESARVIAEATKANYNLNNKEDVQKFSDNIKNKLLASNAVTKKTLTSTDSGRPLLSAEACLTVAAVVAGVVWEVGAAVNVVAVATVGVFVAAVFIYKGKVITSDAAAEASLGLGALTNDKVVVSVSKNY